jgi:hypothetical membrane protein
MRTLRLLAACGMIAPLLFAAALAVFGALYPGYNPLRQQMSVLGATGAPHAALFNGLGLILPGILIVAFAAGLQKGIRGPEHWLGPAMVALGGAGMLAAAIFRCEPGCVGGTRPAQLHQAASAGIAFLAIAPVVIVPRLRLDPRWARHANRSFAAGLVALGFAVVWALNTELGLGRWEGLLQRAIVAAGLVWLEAMAILLWRRSREAAPGPPASDPGRGGLIR